MSNGSVSTRIASELLSVHESSVKRWCNSGELSFWLTPGGHRRIPISKLVTFAEGRGIDSLILRFEKSAERVWIGLEAARKDDDFSILSSFALELLSLGRVYQVEYLVVFLVEQGIELSRVFDRVLGRAMQHVGKGYTTGEISVAQEHRMTHFLRDALIGMGRALHVDESESNAERTAVVGCIRGEVHEIGALMIRLILIRQGWNVVYLGQNVPTEEYHPICLEQSAELVCISVAAPQGTAEANDVVKLLDGLFLQSSGNDVGVRLALGGPMLGDTDSAALPQALKEVAFFSKTEPFENWLVALSQ